MLLKDNFKETRLCKNGFIFLNKKVRNEPKTLLEYQEPSIPKNFDYTMRTHRSRTTLILDNTAIKQNKVQPN